MFVICIDFEKEKKNHEKEKEREREREREGAKMRTVVLHKSVYSLRVCNIVRGETE